MPVFRWTALLARLLALLLVLLSISSRASAATLPGLPLVFDTDGHGTWTLAEDQPESVLQAGCQPGWVLTAVDGRPVDDGLALQRRVAAGPARSIQLQFNTGTTDQAAGQDKPAEPEPLVSDVIVVVPRAPLVVVAQIGIVPWPTDFVPPAGPWQQNFGGTPALVDASGVSWLVNLNTGGLERVDAPELSPQQVPGLFWVLSDATWVIERSDAVTSGDSAWAAQVMAGATRVQIYQGRAADHLLVPMDQGLEVLEVQWPLGTPQLPTCTALVPETCLASGKQILAQLDGRPGAREEASRQFGLACANGVHRACYEAVAIEDPSLSDDAKACVNGAVAACNSVAERRLRRQPDNPDDLVLGLLDYACEMEGSGSLGERLRRLEDVGAGCMMLSKAYDSRGMPDRALLNLDQACVLGRADACEQAAQRRHQAFAARTIRECENEKLPIAASCVEQGRLLQTEDIETATLDDFDAFLRGCTLGAIDGCVLLGDYVDRWGIENPRVVKAETQLRRACNDGEQRACMGAAHLLVRHDPKTDAYGDALKLFTQACYDGLASACVAGAEQRRIGQAHKIEAPDQITMWTKACDASDTRGCAGLGQRLVRSRKTWPETFAAWTKACDLGDAHACTQLGLLVERHHPEPWQGEQEQDRYLTQACDNDDPEGCYWLAEDDIPRKGEPPEAAYLLLAQSCEGDYGPGCAELADVHLDRKTSFDDEIAARHLDTACANGHYDSCRVLGSMYLRGKGVERDRGRANELLERFRLNAPRKHVRLGLSGGFPVIVGAEAEIVLPIPVGPALSIGGTYSWIPSGGAAFILLRGEGQPSVFPDLQVVTMTARVYPNTQARGI
ncbi:MAG: sel1 repeat family protein, partial [Oligoflexia bacterium]|nr:sel1 repeat family protein [Oligoflexia bacterium]